MPNRILREGILTSERVAKLDWSTEVFYRRLMSVVDDFGRYFAQPMLLRAACFPLQIDRVTDQDIERWLAAAQAAGLVLVYSVAAGKRCLQLVDFRQQQRAKQSKFPAHDEQSPSTCAAPATHLQASAHLDVCEGEGEGEGEGASKRAVRPRTSRTYLDPKFGISRRVEAWATREGYDRLSEHLDAFKRKCSANGYKYANWDDAFMEAVRQDWAKLRDNFVRAADYQPSPASQRKL